MKRPLISSIVLSALAVFSVAVGASGHPSHVWTVIAVDPLGDGRKPVGFDAAQLSYQYDKTADMLWLRLALFELPKVEEFKVELAIDAGTNDARTPWWGSNTAFTFDRLVTARVNRRTGTHHGSVEIRGTTGSTTSRQGQCNGAEVRVMEDAVLIGFKRAALLGAARTMKLIAAVGPDVTWNDDIPNDRSATIDLEEPWDTRRLRAFDVSRNNLTFSRGQPVLSDSTPPRIVQRGRGPQTLVLISGVYSGESAFDGFMARNESAYTFYVVMPPGLDGTPARPLPPETSSAGDFTWTRRLERDIVDLIARQHLDKPIIVAHGFPGTLAAEELAVTHPSLLGGIVEIAGMPPRFFPAPRDPGKQATPAERVTGVDRSWVPFWFKYVTPETWEANNYPAEMFSNDRQRSERARRQGESAPLPVKIRYLIESMAWDHRADFEKPGVPVLALIPGFSEQLLANPRYGWFKAAFQDSWEPLRNSARLELTTVTDARVLMLDDQPSAVDQAIARFVGRPSPRPAFE